MITTIIKYQTSDGTEFDLEDEAAVHELEQKAKVFIEELINYKEYDRYDRDRGLHPIDVAKMFVKHREELITFLREEI